MGGDDGAGPPPPESGPSLDPAAATTVDELAELLRSLRIRTGEPSLRTLERRSLAARADGRPGVSLSRSTVSAVLNAERLPTHEVLAALLEALDVPPGDRPGWLQARARIAESRREPAVGPPAPVAGDARVVRPTRRWLLLGGVGLAVAGVTAVLVAMSRPVPPTADISCTPPSCAATGPKLAVHGRMSGDVPDDRQVVLLIRVDNTQRWYLGPTVTPVDGEWTRQVGVGNPVPQPHDRYFTVCLDVLPGTAVPELAAQMVQNAGDGLAVDDLPDDRVELACRPATRVQNT